LTLSNVCSINIGHTVMRSPNACLSPLEIGACTSLAMLSGSPHSSFECDSDDAAIQIDEHGPQQQILRQNKGLRHFSKQVADKVEQKRTTTYNEVSFITLVHASRYRRNHARRMSLLYLSSREANTPSLQDTDDVCRIYACSMLTTCRPHCAASPLCVSGCR
jgi:hypothetical protein